LVVQTFSKSRSLAGGRLGFAVGCKELIRDLKTIQYSTNPYNVNRMTMAAGIGALEDTQYFESNCKKIRENRAWTTDALRKMDFTVLDSNTNFILARHSTLGGKTLYLRLKEEGILVRHFDTPRLTDYVRITIGNREQMEILVRTVKKILEE
jgi:histidinol-phosphate aminotransferase